MAKNRGRITKRREAAWRAELIEVKAAQERENAREWRRDARWWAKYGQEWQEADLAKYGAM